MYKRYNYRNLFLSLSIVAFILVACSASSSTSVTSSNKSPIATTDVPSTLTSLPTETTPSTPSASPTPTPPPPPTTVLVPRLYTIDVTREGNAPSDLQEYVFAYYSGAGGGCGDCCSKDGPPTWSVAYDGATVPALPQTLFWVAIDLKANSPLQVTISLPDGSTKQYEESTSFLGCTFFRFEVVPGTILGKYSIEFVQGNTILMDSFTLAMPTDPISVVYDGNEWFSGFQSYEQVTLWLYYEGSIREFHKPEIAAIFPQVPLNTKITELANDGFNQVYAFLGKQIVTADEYGTFQVKYTSEQLELLGIFSPRKISTVAQGETSGLISANQSVDGCNGSLPTRLSIGDSAVVTNESDRPNQIPGTMVTLVLGPICSSGPYGVFGGWQWIVDTASTTNLLFTECNSKVYYLEPVNP